jgi:hypothetical protein
MLSKYLSDLKIKGLLSSVIKNPLIYIILLLVFILFSLNRLGNRIMNLTYEVSRTGSVAHEAASLASDCGDLKWDIEDIKDDVKILKNRY